MVGIGVGIDVGLSGPPGIPWVQGTYRDIAGGDSPPAVTRAAPASYFSAARVLSMATPNVARVTHDPLTGERLGLLVEGKDGANLTRWSNDLTQPQWSKSACTISPDAARDPAGGMAADLVLETTATGNHGVSVTTSFAALAADTVFTGYLVMKAGRRTRAKLIANPPTGAYQVVVDLLTGEIDQQFTSHDPALRSARSRRLGNGWVLVVLQFIVPAGATSWTLNRNVFNGGVGGETSAQIRTRMLADHDHQNWLTILEAGRNDGADQAAIESNIAAMTTALPPGSRYLVISVPFAGDAEIAEIAHVAGTNSALSATYGERFVAINWGTIDRVIDNLHPSDAGNTILASAIATRIHTLGW